MAILKINRPSEYTNHIRDYRLYLNGKKLGTLANGQSKEFTIPAGEHRLIAKIDWCSSPELVVNLNDSKPTYLYVGGFQKPYWSTFSIIVLVLHFILKFRWNFDYAIFLLTPLFLIMVYYSTIGRHNYLTLTDFPNS